MAESIDFSRTQRIVLLIDLNPLLHIQNPNPYLTSILTASKYLLSFPSLSSSLFAFKFFFSSLSPLRSSSALHRLLPISPSTSLCFNHPAEILPSLSKTLNSLSKSPISTQSTTSLARASHTASSLLQLVHDYSWEPQIENLSGTQDNFPVIRSNLIILFSPIYRSLKCLSEFMSVDMNDASLRTSGGFCLKFHNCFSAVNDAFVSRDIHFSWIDANFNEERIEIDESASQLGLFEDGIRSLGWGFCSTDVIVLGSAVVPFGLIYPMIGTPFNYLNFTNLHKSIHAQLSLEISDVSGNPLECNYCDLELLNLKMSPRLKSDSIMNTLEYINSESEGFNQDETFWGHFGDGITKMHVKAVQSYADAVRFEGCFSNHILVRGFLGESGKSKKKCFNDFFANRVLELLSREMGEFVQMNSVPIWQILLSFLYRECSWALVTVSNSSMNSCMGILKPFTAHLALLSIIDNGNIKVHDFGGSNLTKIDNLICRPHTDTINSNECVDSQIVNSSSGNYVPLGDGKRKKSRKHVYQDLTWSSFCKAAFECSYLDLSEIYFVREFNKSKKLKFLKCWMKQIKKCSHRPLTIPDVSKSHQNIAEEIDERHERLIETHQESEQLMSPHFSSEPSRVQDRDAAVSCSETSESFFCNLPKKIQQGLESEGVDLQILAERLVISSIHWLHQKCEAGNIPESQTPTINLDDSFGRIVSAELIKLLTKEPKELKEKRKDKSLSFQASDLGSTLDNIVREYELQILLRMEILRSEVAGSIEEFTKQKLVKQICSFLEIIQYLVEGGFHGHVSLYDYVERTIKNRYSHTLRDVVNGIYAKMDLLPFGEENESQVLLLNSEDSNQSWREKQYEITETNKIHEPLSVEDKCSQSLKNVDESLQGIRREEHDLKLCQARERRERARRFVSFTSWVPDLQRVWAPKQAKATKTKSESLQKASKRKERRRASYSVVCETPMTGIKRSCSRGSNIGDDEHQDHGSNSSTSISKALFQDDQ